MLDGSDQRFTRRVSEVKLATEIFLTRPFAPSLDELLEMDLKKTKDQRGKKIFRIVTLLKRAWHLHAVVKNDEKGLNGCIKTESEKLEKFDDDSLAYFEIEQKLKSARKHLEIIKYRGLTNEIKEVFIPSIPVNFHWTFRSRSTKEIGSRVHRELKEWINYGWIKLRSRDGRNWERPHKFTKAVLKFTHNEDIRLLSAEIPLRSPCKRIIGWIDAIGLRKTKDGLRSVLIDWKTGFENQRDVFGKLKYPFMAIPATNLVKYTIQMAILYMICKVEYKFVFDDVYLIQVTDGVCGIVKLDEETWERKDEFYEKLKNF